MKALIVDDEASGRKVLRYYVEALDGLVIEAGNGAEALALAGKENPDIIISDVQMPVMDGFQLLREIRLRSELCATPFILYSAVYSGADDRSLALSLGADAFILKPKDPQEFWRELQTSLRSTKDRKRKAIQKLQIDEQTFLRKYSAVVAEQLDQTVHSLRSQEELFRATFEQAAVGIAHVGLDGRWLEFNNKLCEFIGYSKTELAALTFQDITHPDDLEAGLDHRRRMLAGEISSYSREKRYIRKDGGIVWGNLSLSLLRTPDGVPKCFIFVITDITSRKQAQEEARTIRRNYLDLLRSIVDGMIITDGKGTVTLLNQAAKNIPGLIREGALGKLITEALVNQDLAGHIHDCLQEIGIGMPLEVKLLDPVKREVRDFQAITSVARNDRQQVTGSITLLRDLTAERESDRLKSEFIATAAHELRTPLTSVMGYADLLLAMKDDNRAFLREGLTIIAEKSQVLEKIVDDLLDLSRVEQGRTLLIDRVECDLGELLSRIVQQYRRDCVGRTFDLCLNITLLRVSADPARIVQVVENLLSNAVKFSAKDSPISIVYQHCGEELQISVRDAGIGMTSEQAERAFEKFYRADTGNTARQGLGLGLAIAKNIIEAHGGRIWLTSEPGRGTEVCFSLPTPRSPEQPAQQPFERFNP